jgi:hypothetical protein
MLTNTCYILDFSRAYFRDDKIKEKRKEFRHLEPIGEMKKRSAKRKERADFSASELLEKNIKFSSQMCNNNTT